MKLNERILNKGQLVDANEVETGIYGMTEEEHEELAQLEAALTLIGDVAYDRDGYTDDAEKLGALIDEIYGYARNPQSAVDALKEGG